MAKPPRNDLATFVRQQPADVLAHVLLELADTLPQVRKRLERLQLAHQPDKLSAAFRKQLSAWKRSTRFVAYGEAREFGQSLEAWLDQVAQELQPLDPAAALALFEAFIEADAGFFERADDSNGAIGDAVRKACGHWLDAAAQCETPASAWPERLMQLSLPDGYGGREPLLREAHRLLDEAALRALAERFLEQLDALVRAHPNRRDRPHEVYRLSGAITSLAEALRDPDVHVRATLLYSPEPNPLQKAHFVDGYLAAGRPADALPWLQGDWGRDELTRKRLLSDARAQLGQAADSAATRREVFEASLSTLDLQRWLDTLPEAERPDACAQAHALALRHDDAVTAAPVLLALDDPSGAEQRLVQSAGTIDGQRYDLLVPLATALRQHDCARGETAVLRALLAAILARATASAYGHAARYLHRLREIAATGASLAPLAPHADLEQQLKTGHARKVAFWAQVEKVGR